MAIDRIHDYIVPGKRAHLVGIGGVSMSPPWRRFFRGEGLVITGSDVKESLAVEHLRSLGIPWSSATCRKVWRGKDLVIRTAAVHDSNPEIAAAHALGFPSSSGPRPGARLWRYENAPLHFRHPRQNHHHFHVHPLPMAARVDPTVMIGGTLPILGTGHRVGKGKDHYFGVLRVL